MYKKISKSQYHVGNDREIPDSAFVASSWLDGIYTQFDASVAPNGWADVQETYKMHLPQSKWEENEKTSGFQDKALFSPDYDKADSKIVSEAFPDLFTSGRSEYVEK